MTGTLHIVIMMDTERGLIPCQPNNEPEDNGGRLSGSLPVSVRQHCGDAEWRWGRSRLSFGPPGMGESQPEPKASSAWAGNKAAEPVHAGTLTQEPPPV